MVISGDCPSSNYNKTQLFVRRYDQSRLTSQPNFLLLCVALFLFRPLRDDVFFCVSARFLIARVPVAALSLGTFAPRLV